MPLRRKTHPEQCALGSSLRVAPKPTQSAPILLEIAKIYIIAREKLACACKPPWQFKRRARTPLIAQLHQAKGTARPDLHFIVHICRSAGSTASHLAINQIQPAIVLRKGAG